MREADASDYDDLFAAPAPKPAPVSGATWFILGLAVGSWLMAIYCFLLDGALLWFA